MARKLSGFSVKSGSGAVVGAAVFALSWSCSFEVMEAVDSTEDGLRFGNGVTAWPGPTIPVCFKNGFTQAQRDAIQSAVEENWNREGNIVFGFSGTCPASPGSNMVATEIEPALTGLGLSPAGKNDSNWVKFKSGSPSVHTILHEFGHILGFMHEHKEDGTCDVSTTDVLVSPQSDPQTSIMSQSKCNTVTRLSPNDIVGFQHVYGRKFTGAVLGLGSKCVRVHNSSTAHGTKLTAQDCNLGIQGSRWFWNQNGQLQTTIHTGGPSATELCARVQGGAVKPNDKTPLVTGSCSGAPAFEPTELLIKGMGGLCMAASSNAAGAKLTTKTCDRTSTSMVWKLENLGSNQRRIVHSASGLCVQIGSATKGDEPTLQTCSSSSKQKFIVANGLITPAGQANVCLNVFGGLPVTNKRIGLWDECGTAIDSFWHASGRFKTMGQCVDMFGGSAYNGVQVGMYPCTSPATNDQIWDYRF